MKRTVQYEFTLAGEGEDYPPVTVVVTVQNGRPVAGIAQWDKFNRSVVELTLNQTNALHACMAQIAAREVEAEPVV